MAIASPQVEPLLPPTGNDAVDWTITTPGTYVGYWADGLGGTELLQAQFRFLYGTGSGGIRVCLQSSLDQGTTAFDVVVEDFAAVAKTAIFAIRQGSSSTVLAPGEGGNDAAGFSVSPGVQCSVLGDRFRLKVIVTGTYANTVLSSRILAS